MVRIAVLGSGSSGNTSIVQCGNTSILIDAGLSAKQINLRLETLGIQLTDINGIILTHEHSDHTGGLRVLLKNQPIPIYANALTREALENKVPNSQWKVFQNNQDFSLENLTIHSFPVPHDAQDPVGFTISYDQIKIGILTDTGHITKTIKNALKNLDLLYIEANYDELLLSEDTKRPWSIKQRISSKHGHLSNEQAAQLYTEISNNNLKTLIIGHLSSDCNHPEKVKKAFLEHCSKNNTAPPQQMLFTQQSHSSPWVNIQEIREIKKFNESTLTQGEMFT